MATSLTIARKVAYVAGDDGPRSTLEALASRLPGARALEAGTGLLICGTSDTPAGREIESRARIAANERGVPCAVIEDFPGNYSAVPGGRPRLVFVDSEFAAGLARRKEGSLDVQIVPAVRYDALRRRLKELRSAPAADENAVLWIGQPETGDSLETLARLLPAFAARGATVWFRAHPRDEGYARGAYAGLKFEDVTPLALADCLARRPRLVVTQFSSVAIEAGFWGIPSLNVLFADVGGRTLVAKKGYAVPPWCEQGAAFLLARTSDVDEVLDRGLASEEARSAALRAFDRYFSVHEEGAPAVINLLYNQGLL